MSLSQSDRQHLDAVVTEHVGYRLKRTHAALRGAMDAALRGHDLTVPQYACLEILALRPGLSNAELARATFVSRQSMNLVLRGLQEAGLVERPDVVDQGRARPVRLTDAGGRRLDAAQVAVHAVEERLLAQLPPEHLPRLLEDLDRLADALGE